MAIVSSIDSASSDRRDSGVVGRLQQASEGDLLAEHRGRLGQRQAGALVEDPLGRGQCEVHAVTELVRQREHVAASARSS